MNELNYSKESLLSGEELVNANSQQKSFSLSTTGCKFSFSTGSFLEKKHVDSRIRNLRDLASFPRVNQKNQMSSASWNTHIKKAMVTKATGKYWETFGHLEDSQLCLLPEEALFLLECGNLHLTFEGVPVSLQQAYELLLGVDCSLEEYLMFSSLSRLGYKVVRHQGNLGITKYEQKIHLDKFQGKRKKKRESQNSEISKHFKSGIAEPFKDSGSHLDDSMNELETAHKGACIESTDVKSSVCSALLSGSLSALWKSGTTMPMIMPADATSTVDILDKLRHKSLVSLHLSKTVCGFKITYDVYLPTVQLKKSVPTLPNYRMVVVTADSQMPCAEDLKAIQSHLSDEVQIVFAVCSVLGISYFEMTEISLPTEVTIG